MVCFHAIILSHRPGNIRNRVFLCAMVSFLFVSSQLVMHQLIVSEIIFQRIVHLRAKIIKTVHYRISFTGVYDCFAAAVTCGIVGIVTHCSFHGIDV